MSKIALILSNQIPWEVFIENCNKHIPNEIKIHLLPLCKELVDLLKDDNKIFEKNWIVNTLLRLESCLDRTWEELNTGHWKYVAIQQRYCFTICSVLKVR